MKNLVGGILGAIIACALMSFMSVSPLHIYPEPFDQIWFLLDGPRFLEIALLQVFTNTQNLVSLLASICGAGVIISLFSESSGKAIRTTLLMGAVLGSIYVSSVLLIDLAFWTSIDRNIALLMIYIQNIAVSLLSLIIAIPLVWVMKNLRNSNGSVVPSKIETICECGAVFKSRPMICSECGKELDYLSTLSTDTATQ